MVVDSSALISIILDEPGRDKIIAAVADAVEPVVSAANYLEVVIVMLAKQDDNVQGDLRHLLASLGIQVLAVTPAQADLAAEAYARYGKGRHPAALNFGDCFAYALARERRAALLFVGEDFARTDLAPALV